MVKPGSICICTVTAGEPNWLFVESIFCLKAPGEKMFRYVMGKQGVDEGHNRVIDLFLTKTEYEWMLHVDSDAVLHRETLLRLLSWEVPFVSALAFQRKPPFKPVIYTDLVPGTEDAFVQPVPWVVEWLKAHPDLLTLSQPAILDPRPDDALWKVNRGGAHCCLTHRSVLEAIEPPWYTRSGARAGEGCGSDFTFHRKAIEAGFQPHVDMSVVAGHSTGTLCIGALNFLVWETIGMMNQSEQDEQED